MPETTIVEENSVRVEEDARINYSICGEVSKTVEDGQLFTVVICTHHFNRYHDTIEAINSILEQTYPEVEIVLVIDRNRDLFNKFVEFYNDSVLIRVVLNSEQPGLSGSRNKGVQSSSGAFIAFLDDDAIADKEWLKVLKDAYADSEIIGCGGPIRPLWVCGQDNSIPEEFYWTMGCTYRGFSNYRRSVRSNFGSNMSFRRSAFNDNEFNLNAGLLDNKGVGEEIDLSLRILSAYPQSKIMHIPEAVVYHKIFKFRKSYKHLFNRCYQYGRSIGYYSANIAKLPSRVDKDDANMMKYILMTSFPERVLSMFKQESNTNLKTNISQIVLIFLSSITIIYGMLLSKVFRRDIRTSR